MSHFVSLDGLVTELRTWAGVEPVEGGFLVTFPTPGGERTVELVLDGPDWEEMSFVIGGTDPTRVRRQLETLSPDHAFLVSDAGAELVGSRTRELPDDDLVPPGPGRWFAENADGSRGSSFADWLREHPEEDERTWS